METNWIPFKINLVDNKDTLSSGFDFYLTSGDKEFRPTINDSLKCFQFKDVAIFADFNISYKSKNYKFKNVEIVRYMYGYKWTVTLDTLAPDNCYEIIADYYGCFANVYLGPYPIPKCNNKHYILVSSFLPEQLKGISLRETIKLKKSKRGKK